jgi:hypothetical protein
MSAPTTPVQRAEWEAWLATRPKKVREVASAYPPWHTYELLSTGQLCSIQHYDEHDDGSVTLSIIAWREWLPLPIGVFGIDPEDLVVQDGA